MNNPKLGDAGDRSSAKGYCGAVLQDLLQGRVSKRQSLEDQLLELFPDRDHANIIRQARNGEPISNEVARGIATHAQLTLFSDAAFKWEVEFSRLRELIHTASLPSVMKRLLEIEADLREPVSESRRVKLLYCASLAQFRLVKESGGTDLKLKHLELAIHSIEKLKIASDRAGSSASHLFGHIALVNKAAFKWQRLVLTENKEANLILEICREGLQACMAGYNAHPTWIGARRDAAEYAALLAAADMSGEFDKTLDQIILDLIKLFTRSPANFVVKLLQDRMEVSATKQIERNANFQKLLALTVSDKTGRVGRIGRDFLKP